MKKLLAKSDGMTLSEHIKNVLGTARVVLNNLPEISVDKKILLKQLEYATVLHDIGKIASGFQKSLEDNSKWGHRHEILSAIYASQFQEIEFETIIAILTHHKSFNILKDKPLWFRTFIRTEKKEFKDWQSMRNEWLDNCKEMEYELGKIFEEIHLNICLSMPEKLENIHLKNIISEKENWDSYDFNTKLKTIIIRGLTVTSDHMASAKEIPKKFIKFSDFDVTKDFKKLHLFQIEAKGHKGNAILRAPTGSGKTEASLLWAQNNQSANGRLFYILPYTASINAMHKRFSKKYFNDSLVGLMHSKATSALYSIISSEIEENRFNIKLTNQSEAKSLAQLAKEMYYPIRVCTPHQILKAGLGGKGWDILFPEFFNACFVFDEIHAYDPKLTGLSFALIKVLKEIFNAQFLFISATFPKFLEEILTKEFFNNYLTKIEDTEMRDQARHVIKVIPGTIIDYIDEIVEMSSHNKILIICNHVPTAKEVYEILAKKMEKSALILLHGRFNQEDRNFKEQNLDIDNPGYQKIKILISTQVVEVSLDINFDIGYFEPAPIDALAQRMGRVNRKGNNSISPAPIFIFENQINKYKIYSSFRSDETLKYLQNTRKALTEFDLVNIIDNVYKQGYLEEEQKSFNNAFKHEKLFKYKENLYPAYNEDWVDQIIDNPNEMIEVLPFNLDDRYRELKEEGLWIEANSLLVPLRYNPSLSGKIDFSKKPYLANLNYDSDVGLYT